MISATVFFCIMTTVVFSQPCIAAQREQAIYKGGECTGCHGQEKLPLAHPNTKAMNLQSCKKCHSKENRDIRGKLPGSHYHLLANITCEQCHGKGNEPGVPAMEQCIACHSKDLGKDLVSNLHS